MALIKKRPELRLLAPPEVRPGQSFVAEVIVRAHRPVPVDSLDAQFVGVESVTVGGGKQARTATKRWVGQQARLSEARRMVGEQRFKVRFQVPENVPASYLGCQARVEYLVKIRASIPWWPDARANFVIRVVPPAAEFEDAPFVFSSNPAGPTGTEPHVEASLASTHLRPGGSLEGAVALSNVQTNRYSGIQVKLRGRQVAEAYGSRVSTWCFEYTLNLPAEEIREGIPVPFSMRIPEVYPTTRGSLFSLSWVIEVCARRRFTRDEAIRAPVIVLPKNVKASTRARVVPPTVGSLRVQAVWSRVASEVGLAFQDDHLVGNVGDVRLVIRRDSRGRDGNYLLGTLTFPSLHLGLDAGPLGGFARYVSLSERFEWPDEHHYFVGRELAQVRAFAQNLLPENFPHEIVDAADELLIIQQKGGGQSRTELLRFAKNLSQVSRNLAAAVAQIPAPAQFSKDAVEAWQRLAQELAGALELSRMAVRGVFEGRRVSVCTHWTNRGPWQTEVTLVPLQAFGDKYLLEWVASDGPLPEVRLKEDARKALEAAFRDASGGVVANRKLSVSLPAPLTDAGAALGRLNDLVNLELALSRRGAYR